MYNYEGDSSYGEDRCCNSIVSLGGEPFWYLYYSAYDGIRGRHILTGEELYFSREAFDPTPVHIGYMNGKGFTKYLSRLPIRQWKQGLRSANMAILGEDGTITTYLGEDVCSSKAFYDAYMGRYPSLPTIIGRNYKHKAFSREYAAKQDGKELKLVRRGFEVGLINPYSAQIELHKDYSFLQDEVEEILHGAV